MGYSIFDFGFQSRIALLDMLCETCADYNFDCECERCIVEKVELAGEGIKEAEREPALEKGE